MTNDQETWADEDDDASSLRGWSMFECFEGRSHPPIEVQALTDHEDGSVALLNDDSLAWADIYDGVLAGDPLCERAVLFLFRNSPDELRHILDYCAPQVCVSHVKEPRHPVVASEEEDDG